MGAPLQCQEQEQEGLKQNLSRKYATETSCLETKGNNNNGDNVSTDFHGSSGTETGWRIDASNTMNWSAYERNNPNMKYTKLSEEDIIQIYVVH